MTLLEHPTAAIAVERRPACHVCGASGRESLRSLRDRLSSVAGDWNLRTCSAPNCGLVWLDPMPCDSELPRLYPGDYFTHAPQRSGGGRLDPNAYADAMSWRERFRSGWRQGTSRRCDQAERVVETDVWTQIGARAARLLEGVPGVAPALRHPELWLPVPGPSARLLDVGCGSGAFLASMRDRGWDVVGLEPDPAAVRAALMTGSLHVVQGTLETLPADAGTFDAVTLLHVIEHLPNPRESLRKARQLLRPGGRILIVTPNARSLGTRMFDSAWVGWDPPRHLHLFTGGALDRLLLETGFSLERAFTSGRNARWIWEASDEIRRTGRCRSVDQPQSTLRSRWVGRLARLAENALPRFSECGEELVAIGIKPPDDMPAESPRHTASS